MTWRGIKIPTNSHLTLLTWNCWGWSPSRWALKSFPGDHERQLKSGTTLPRVPRNYLLQRPFPAYKSPFPQTCTVPSSDCLLFLSGWDTTQHVLSPERFPLLLPLNSELIFHFSSRQYRTGVIRAMVSLLILLVARWPWASHNLQASF